MGKRGQRPKSDEAAGFLVKTYKILQCGDYREVIQWTDEGRAFTVVQVNRFSTEVLPIFFKHSNYTSFVRQLNMYDFHKRKETDHIFSHPLFQEGRFELLREIKRKVAGEEGLVLVASEGGVGHVEKKHFQLEEWCKRVSQQNEQILKENQALHLKISQTIEQRNAECMMFYWFVNKQFGDKLPKRVVLTS